MKRFFQLMIVAIVVITACCACSKVNDIDKRLGVLENIVSDLKAQIVAGAVITSVDKTSDGCTFTLSNGQTYTVTNGKDGADGTDGEAIIADVKIEEDFIVLTLKNGETLRISYQNPLSMVTLNIVPDYDDGTVGKPETVEAMGMKSHIFYLDISVTPAKYTEILSDAEKFIHKAVFSPVLTKSGFGNAFTVSPKSVIYMDGAPVPFLQASFELDDESAAVLQNTPYTVSYSIEDKDGVHGTATAFVTISNDKGSGGDNPTDNVVPEGALPSVFSVSATKKVYFSKGNLWSEGGSTHALHFEDNQWSSQPASDGEWNSNHVSHFFGAENIAQSDAEIGLRYEQDFFAKINNTLTVDDEPGWYVLSGAEWDYLISGRFINKAPGFGNTCVWKEVHGVNGLVIFPDNYKLGAEATWEQMEAAGCVFLPATGSRSGSVVIEDSLKGLYWSSSIAGPGTAFLFAFVEFGTTSTFSYHNVGCSIRMVRDCD